MVNVANGNSAVDDCIVLNVTPDTTTADVLHKVRSKLTLRIRYDTVCFLLIALAGMIKRPVVSMCSSARPFVSKISFEPTDPLDFYF